MTAPTHIAFSSSLYLIIAGFFSFPISILHLSFCALGSLLPDIDHPLSALGRAFFFLSTPIERIWGHRTITHSLVGLAIFALIFFPLYFFSPTFFYILIFGILSHQILDQNNISGTEFFWPHHSKTVLPLNRNWRTTVGSKAEILIFLLFSISVLFLWSPSRIGYFQAIRYLIGDFETTRKEYLETCGEKKLFLKGKLKDTITQKTLSNQWEIIGVQNSKIIVWSNGKKKTVGYNDAHFYPLKTRIQQGKKIQILVQRISMKNLRINCIEKYIQKKYQYYLSGQLKISCYEDPPQKDYNPLQFSNGILHIQYATWSDLEKIKNTLCQEGYIDIQYRLSENQKVPPIVAQVEQEKKEEEINIEKYLK